MDLLTIITSLLGGLNVTDAGGKAAAWLNEFGAGYPDVRSRTDAMTAWLMGVVAEAKPELDPQKLRDTLWGVASDIVNGAAGIDPGAHHGAG
jgi:hypothetical protein